MMGKTKVQIKSKKNSRFSHGWHIYISLLGKEESDKLECDKGIESFPFFFFLFCFVTKIDR